jgi:hypothetical protein
MGCMLVCQEEPCVEAAGSFREKSCGQFWLALMVVSDQIAGAARARCCGCAVWSDIESRLRHVFELGADTRLQSALCGRR